MTPPEPVRRPVQALDLEHLVVVIGVARPRGRTGHPRHAPARVLLEAELVGAAHPDQGGGMAVQHDRQPIDHDIFVRLPAQVTLARHPVLGARGVGPRHIVARQLPPQTGRGRLAVLGHAHPVHRPRRVPQRQRRSRPRQSARERERIGIRKLPRPHADLPALPAEVNGEAPKLPDPPENTYTLPPVPDGAAAVTAAIRATPEDPVAGARFSTVSAAAAAACAASASAVENFIVSVKVLLVAGTTTPVEHSSNSGVSK